jgi:uncharacterized damage-inducible protein DinB
MSDGSVATLLAALDEAFDRRSWHGTNLRGSIRGLSPAAAAWRPAARRHSIWEIVVHAAYWKYVVRRRLTGAPRGSFALAGSNWFSRPVDPGRRAWERDVDLLVGEHRQLRTVVASLTARDLDRPSGGTVTTASLVRGIIAHDLYHAGQIQLLKRLQQR